MMICEIKYIGCTEKNICELETVSKEINQTDFFKK
jgi:hypothetical protein